MSDINVPPGHTGPFDDRTRYLVPLTRPRRHGRSGSVYEAVLAHELGDVPSGTRVGLKSLLWMDDERYEKVRDRTQRIPRHPHLARHVECFEGPPPQASDADEDDFVYYSAHVWVDGRSFAEASAEAKPREILEWGRQIASAIDALHAAPGGGLAHRDVHGRNILVTPAGEAVLIDFDTILWGDHVDTGVAVLSSLNGRGRAQGLTGAQADDRAALALALLQGFARDTTSLRPSSELPGSAVATVTGVAADPVGAISVLTDALDSPPKTATMLVDALDRRFAETPATPIRSSKLSAPRAALGLSAVAILVAVGVLVLLLGQLGDHPSSSITDASDRRTALGPSIDPSTVSTDDQRRPRHHRRRSPAPKPTSNDSSSTTVQVTSPPRSIAPTLGPTTAGSTPRHHRTVTPPPPTSTSTAPSGYPETPGTGVNTWTDYTTGGGTHGPTVPQYDTVLIECRTEGLKVQDGDTWWYRIASSPWNSTYYGSADAFYNNGSTSGSLLGTPFYDPAVPVC